MFFGWRVAAASFAILFVIIGIVYYSFPVFYVPLIAEFGWTRAQLTAGFALSIIIIGPLFGISSGFLIDRYGPRRVILVGLLLAAVAFLGYSWMMSLGIYYLFYFLQSAGYVVAGPIPNQVLISNWFTRLRGRAMAAAYVGAGLGGAAAPVAAEFLVRHIGWRWTMRAVAGLLVVILVPVVLILIRNRPSDLGLLPDGEAQPESGTRKIPSVPAGFSSLKAVLRTRSFWLIAAGSFLSIGAVGGMIQHLFLFLIENGFASAPAARVMMILLLSSIVGRLVMGWLADRFRKKFVMLAACLCVATAIPVLSIAPSSSAYVFAVIFGFGMGADYMLIPLLTADCFGLRSLGRILGVIITTDAIGQALAPVIVGHLRDIGSNYASGFTVLTGMATLGALAIVFVTKPVDENGGNSAPPLQ